jgi:hypothetical protein
MYTFTFHTRALISGCIESWLKPESAVRVMCEHEALKIQIWGLKPGFNASLEVGPANYSASCKNVFLIVIKASRSL